MRQLQTNQITFEFGRQALRIAASQIELNTTLQPSARQGVGLVEPCGAGVVEVGIRPKKSRSAAYALRRLPPHWGSWIALPYRDCRYMYDAYAFGPGALRLSTTRNKKARLVCLRREKQIVEGWSMGWI